MLSSRMFTPAFRFLAGLTVFSLVAAFIVGISSQTASPMERVLGPLTLGWKGGIGNHFAYVFLVGLAVASGAVAGILVAFRDADPEAEAQVVHAETVPLTRAPAGINYLPALAGFSLVLLLVGLGTESGALAWVSVAILVAVAFTWTLRAWAERATGDDATNAELYQRFMTPLRLPIVSVLSIAVLVIGLSRVLLAVSKTASVVVFGLVALLFFVVAVVLALRPEKSRSVATVLIVLAALAVVAAGIAGAVSGEREFEEHHNGAPAAVVITVEHA